MADFAVAEVSPPVPDVLAAIVCDGVTGLVLDLGAIVPASKTHGVFWPQQPTTHPALSTFNPTHTTAELADQASETGLLTALHPFIVTGISTTVPARVRVYKSTAQRDADLNRAIGTDPSGDHGLLLEAVTTAGQLAWQVSPGVYVPVTVPQVPVTVTNLSGGSTAVVASFTAIALE